MASESNEQFHYSRSPEVSLMRYLWGTRLEKEGLAPDDVREAVYQSSLVAMSDMAELLSDDPREVDRIVRAVMPPRFDERVDYDIDAWQERLRMAPVELIVRGYASLDHDRLNLTFFEELLGWIVEHSKGHSIVCAQKEKCIHSLQVRRDACPVQTSVLALVNEVYLLYHKLHGEYSAHSLANKLDTMNKRIEGIGELLIKFELGTQEQIDAFLYHCEDKAITYATKVNGLASLEE